MLIALKMLSLEAYPFQCRYSLVEVERACNL